MKKQLFLTILFGTLLSACGGSSNITAEDLQSTAAAMAAGTLTEVAANQVTATTAPTETETPTAPPPSETPQVFVAASVTTAPDAPCLDVEITDETYSDGSSVTAGQSFTQTWMLRNIGSCAWTDEFSFVWHHGYEGLQQSSSVGYVAPGQAIPLSVIFRAPDASVTAGEVKSFWSIKSPNGTLFGPGNFEYFWVSVVVPGTGTAQETRDLAATSYSNLIIGDTATNSLQKTTINFDFGNIAYDAKVTALYLNLGDYNTVGNPFATMGCVIVSDGASGSEMWRFCSDSELSYNGYGGDNAIIAVENALLTKGQITLNVSFNSTSDNDNAQDSLQFNYPTLSVSWYKP